MSKYILIPSDNGFISHKNSNPDNYNLPDNAEIYDTEEEFNNRVSDFE